MTKKSAYSGTVDKRVAVVGWQWYRWKEEDKTVRMIPDRVWQWQYWMNDDSFKKVAVAGVADDKKVHTETQWTHEWQWLGGSGTVG
jgi:dTDP-4-dehydrorhamnose 3,5-epimerase-like enzyme